MDPDYSPAYCILATDAGGVGHAFTFTQSRDAITPDERSPVLKTRAPAKETPSQRLQRTGNPAWTAPTGRFGFSEDKMRNPGRQALCQGWTRGKGKVCGFPGRTLRRS